MKRLEATMEQGQKDCWSCAYHNVLLQTTLLGMCTWFEKNNKAKAKQYLPISWIKGAICG